MLQADLYRRGILTGAMRHMHDHLTIASGETFLPFTRGFKVGATKSQLSGGRWSWI